MTVSRQDIEDGLRELGLATGDAVEVHSSLSSFGHVDGGAATVVDALMGVVGESGTIVMSAYRLSRPLPLTDDDRARGVGFKLRILPEDSNERTGMGVIVEEFQRRSRVVCGHGLFRVCAWGKDAGAYAKEEYNRLVDVDGYALLLGVPMHRCSSLHVADHVPLPDKLQQYLAVPEEVSCAYPADIYFGYHEPPGLPFVRAGEEADRRGLIRRHRIGSAECVLFKAKAVVAILEELRRTKPFWLMGLEELLQAPS
jgi:aminoglycoside N3'-acetyltransferase